MSDKMKKQPETHRRPVYEPPHALRLGQSRTGSGGNLCEAPGSGDAFGICGVPGAGALECDSPGSGAEIILDCDLDGLGFLQD